MAAQREWFEKDYYGVLGVDEKASAKDIKSAYRKLSRQYHPDANPGDAAAEERFKDISAAYDVVGDEAKRKEYDEVRRLGPMGGFGGPGGPGGPGGFSFDGDVDLGDLLGGLFNRGPRRRGGAGAGQRPAGPQKGPDLESDLQLSFEGAASGVETTLSITSDVSCGTCHGVGAKPGTTPRQCPVCAGRGVVDDNQGFFSFSAPCQNCRGQGYLIDEPCPTCRGTGTERKARQVKVRVPAGVKDGQRIRLAGRGGPGRNGGPNGDLFVVVKVAQHPIFGRRGDDLTVTVPITFPEAALGAEVAVPTLDGGPVTIKVPAGTRNGRTFRVKGKGLATPKRTGDLLATVEIAIPSKLSKEERRAVEALAAASSQSPRSHLGV
jgi:molecular chaperone DnaJ